MSLPRPPSLPQIGGRAAVDMVAARPGLVLGIVRGHEAAILVDSAPGAGTTFEVSSPPIED